MKNISTFDITKEALPDFLTQIQLGEIQLPDLQRSFCWEDSPIKKLLASISLAWPVGAILLLQTGNPHVRFKPRLVEGVELTKPPLPNKLILDGQQRSTALYMALVSGHPVWVKDKKQRLTQRYYYIDMAKALDANVERESAILSFSESRVKPSFSNERKIDCSTTEQEYESGLFPVSMVFKFVSWRTGYCKYWSYDTEKVELLNRFELEIIKKFEHYQVPIILLRPELPKEAVCQVFEKVNTSSSALTFFDLLTASFASEDFSLRDDWQLRCKQLRQHRVFGHLRDTDFLQSITLVATYGHRQQVLAQLVQKGDASENNREKLPGVGCGRSEVLRLSIEDYQHWVEPVVKAYEEAARFLHSQKIYAAEDLAYPIQVVALVAILTVIGDYAIRDPIRHNLQSWFWTGIFGESYTGPHEFRAAKDILEVPVWLLGTGSLPSTVTGSRTLTTQRLHEVQREHGAIFKGMCALIRQHGAIDFATGRALMDVKFFGDPIETHHIFPIAYCRQRGIGSDLYNSLINRTPLSSQTNKAIGGKAPSIYLAKLVQQGISKQRLDDILRSHLIEPEMLWNDDFDAFFNARAQALLELVERATGKVPAGAPTKINSLQPASQCQSV
ncbi:DUF262 domain-containing protein [Phormidium tenue FACHB-886]|nr:DUF262 domain-containing protein [Phormidium tenue FACHB-886]